MMNTEFGFLLLTVAGLMNASFTLPMKFTRSWAWENTWLVWTFVALLMLPAVATFCTVPELAAVYRMSSTGRLLCVMALGIGWGISQVFFGIAAEAIGIALTFSLVLGTSAAVGALVPLLRLNPEKLHTPAGHSVLLGIATVLLGVAICAVAGRMRESGRPGAAGKQRNNATVGLILAILCGCGAAFMNFGLAFGAPLSDMAIRYGANRASAGNAVWLPLLAAGAIPNLLYCLYLLNRNSSGRNFRRSGLNHWILAFAMGVLWFGSVLLYGASVSQLGPLGVTVGWPLFMSLIVIAASLLGIVTGEWKRSGHWPLTIQLTGVAALVLAIFILARATHALA
jgi:L-rhamnose-H+ transport protein